MLPPMLMKSMGLDPKMMQEVQKGIAKIDFAKVEEFVKKLPGLIEQVEKLDTVMQIVGSTNLTIEEAIKKVYFVNPMYKKIMEVKAEV